MSKKKEKFYVVWEGKKPGIYLSWKDCKAMIDGYAGAKYKSFETFTKAKNARKIYPNVFINRNTFQVLKKVQPNEIAKVIRLKANISFT